LYAIGGFAEQDLGENVPDIKWALITAAGKM